MLWVYDSHRYSPFSHHCWCFLRETANWFSDCQQIELHLQIIMFDYRRGVHGYSIWRTPANIK